MTTRTVNCPRCGAERPKTSARAYVCFADGCGTRFTGDGMVVPDVPVDPFGGEFGPIWSRQP